jgi:putative tricarboxylic transport membrane protein
MTTQQSHTTGPTHKAVEASVTAVIGLFGAVVVYGSIKAGINWGAEGPKAGFFPFYIGLFIIISSLINLFNTLREEDGPLFAEWGQLKQVFSVIIPTGIYVAALPFIGLYIASMIFIAWFMRWLGKYNWPVIAAISLGMPIVTYLVFERWFLVPLPKGPVEEWLGL